MKFIVFRKLAFGQGQGNIMAGLLAAHLWGQEFDRVVCVEKEYDEFHAAFETIHPLAAQHCPTLLLQLANDNQHIPERNQLQAINFMMAPDECYLKERFASSAPEQAVTCRAR